MALADRYYMRDEYHPPRLTTRLIIALLVLFTLQSLLHFYWDIDASDYLALSVDGLRHGRIWQLLTFQFLHATPWPWHVLFNCLGLYFFGRPVEESLGSKRFLWLYLLCGVAGGLLQVLLTVLLPKHPDIPVVGASAGVCGVIAIFCTMNPMQELRIWIYFFPVSILARYFLMFLGLISAFGALIPFDGVAHAAHLGGILLGIGYVRRRGPIEEWLSESPLLRIFQNRRRPSGELYRRRPWKKAPKTPSDPGEFISKEIDPILDKISAQGIHSLTEREQQILDAARKKMGRR